ncbi:MAG: carbamoyltransferase N-terminal domain-containing protein, partial [Candidatus Acidiferrales bacterium]
MISLGLNYSQMHDSSACIVKDGEVLFAVAEERLSRVKHDARFPELAIGACLASARVRANDLDFVCFGWPPAVEALRHDLKCMATGSVPLSYIDIVSSLRRNLGFTHGHNGEKAFLQHFGPTKARFRFVDHHLAHAISAYAFSGFDHAAVLVLDGRGAWEATSLWQGRDGKLEHVWTIPWPNSLGLFYSQFTSYLGFQPYSDEWKVMGLAPYGEPGINLRDFIVPDDNPYRVSARVLLGRDSSATSGIEARLGPRRITESDIGAHHKNLAFAVQDACEEAMVTLARAAVEKTGCRNLSLAGGVALNSKANGKILASGLVDRIFVQPAASDDGVCLGAALAPYMENGGKLPVRKMRHAYLGSESSDQVIEKTLETYK